MKNRYGDEYEYVLISENVYAVVGNLKWWRYGGKEGQEEVDLNDLGFADPSGGPFIAVGMKIGDKKVKRISAVGETLHLEVE